jgi:hypothetical protein
MTEINLFKTDKTSLTSRDKELLDLAMSIDHGTPLYKARHFVGDAQITAYAKYKQMMLELRSREEIIEQTQVAIAKNQALIELAIEQRELATSPAQIKLADLEIITNQNDAAKTERRLKMAYKERDQYITVLKEMYDSGEAFLPDGTDLKEAMLNEELGEKLEAEHWTYRLGKQAALDIIAYGHVGTGNLEAISMMSEAQAAQTLQLAIQWSHTVKSALGVLEQDVLKNLNDGNLPITTKIEKQEATARELQ